MALNVAVDLSPFLRINPCGYAGLEMTDLATLGADHDLALVRKKYLPHLLTRLQMADASVIDAGRNLPEFRSD
jgi:lipoyl(octanoyl) transferase